MEIMWTLMHYSTNNACTGRFVIDLLCNWVNALTASMYESQNGHTFSECMSKIVYKLRFIAMAFKQKFTSKWEGHPSFPNLHVTLHKFSEMFSSHQCTTPVPAVVCRGSDYICTKKIGERGSQWLPPTRAQTNEQHAPEMWIASIFKLLPSTWITT